MREEEAGATLRREGGARGRDQNAHPHVRQRARHQRVLCLLALLRYKSTNTDAFTGANVHMLTELGASTARRRRRALFTCFTRALFTCFTQVIY